MKVSYKVHKVDTVHEELPDHFGYDESRRGKIVDILVGEETRNLLYREDQHVVTRAAADLREAYEKATSILALFCEVQS